MHKFVVVKIQEGKRYYLAHGEYSGLEWVGNYEEGDIETDPEYHFENKEQAERFLNEIGREEGCEYRIN